MSRRTRFIPPARRLIPKTPDLTQVATEEARRDTCALMIGMMFYKTVGSMELMQETLNSYGDDPERLQGVIGVLLNYTYQFATMSETQPHRWKELTDHLASTLNIETPEDRP